MKKKPEVNSKPTAYEVLNQFLSEKGIALGVGKAPISYTDNNQIFIGLPNIFAVYKEDLERQKLENQKEAN